MTKFDKLADDASTKKAVKALKENGIEAFVVESGKEAKEMALEMIPKGAEVMTMTSATSDAIGLSKEINDSGNYVSLHKKLFSLDRETQGKEMQVIGATPDWAVGSVHAVTEDGKVIVASATGSQLGAYSYGASNVLWIVGSQKIVKNLDDGMKRIYEHTFPLEDARAKKVYGMGSGVHKLLIVNKEWKPGRIKMIIVKENLGF